MCSLEVLDEDGGVWVGVEWVLKEGVPEGVDEDHREGFGALPAGLQLIEELLHPGVERGVAVTCEGVILEQM